MADELLREASDPTTPGERLAELLHEPNRWVWSRTMPVAQAIAVREALLLNPSLPPQTLRRLLLGDGTRPETWTAWQNPSVPLLMMAEPHPDYPEVARRALRWSSGVDAPISLTEAIARWGDPSTHGEAGASRSIPLARRLAHLFNLPWTGP